MKIIIEHNLSSDIELIDLASISQIIFTQLNPSLFYLQSFNNMQPTQINQYTILKKLGNGSYGNVYLAHYPLEQPCALKILEVTQQNSNEIQRQAEMHFTLEHPNILKARDFFFFQKQTCLAIVLDYCADGDLSNFISKIEQNQAKNILTQIVSGILYLHNQKIIHRDIKPENILMLQGIPKIADLGISKLMISSAVSTKIGTQHYLAPEVFFQERYDSKADIWSLGIVALQLFLGRRIFEMVKGIMAPACREGFPSQDLLNEIKDDQLRELVEKMLKKKPKERLNAQQVLDMLEGRSTQKQEIEQQINEEEVEEINELLDQIEIKQEQEINLYQFSSQLKSKWISLSNNNTKAINKFSAFKKYYDLALLEQSLVQKDCQVKFKISKVGDCVALGIVIKNLFSNSQFQFKNYEQFGHGCFMVSWAGRSFSHSHKEHNNVKTNFTYDSGDVVTVEMNGQELIFVNWSNQKEFRMNIDIEEEEWENTFFFVSVNGRDDTVLIE